MVHNISLSKLTLYNAFLALLPHVSELNMKILQGISHKSLHSIRMRENTKKNSLGSFTCTCQRKILENLPIYYWVIFVKLTNMLSFLLLCLPACRKYVDIKEELKILVTITLRKKYPYSELFYSVYSRIRIEYGEIQSITSYSVQMRENTDQNNSEYGHFSRSISEYLENET